MERSVDDDFLYTTEQEVADVSANLPHVVILGAGASYAAFPNGDKSTDWKASRGRTLRQRTRRSPMAALQKRWKRSKRRCIPISPAFVFRQIQQSTTI
ncbi:MAG: hypothetical protein APF80_02305 [Alphaproteobacteria bacterium BRH_c36]|nr:MAG: hypothetical protein APF80_02305 [Alphaproteobacteria bacterium BRH_c36]